MGEQEPLTRTLKAGEARQQWGELLDEVFNKKARIVVEKGGVPVAAIVSAEDLDRLTEYERKREERFKVLDRIGAAFKDVPLEELEREVEKAVAQAREDIRNEKRAQREAQRRSA